MVERNKNTRRIGIMIIGVGAILLSLWLSYQVVFAFFNLVMPPLLLIIPTLIYLAVGISGLFLMKGKNWARITLIIANIIWTLSALLMLFGLVLYLIWPEPSIANIATLIIVRLLQLAISGACISYLCHPKVTILFKKSPAADS